MKKPIIFSVLFFIITAISSFGQLGQGFLELNRIDPETRLWTGIYRTNNGNDYTIGPNANLEGVIINQLGAEWENINLEGANLKNARIEGLTFKKCNFENANFEGARITNTIFTETPDEFQIWRSFRGANFTGARFDRTSFANLDLSGVNFNNALLSVDSRLLNLNLSGADFNSAIFDNMRLSGCNFSNANLTNASFGRNLFSKAYGSLSFNGANLTNADLRKLFLFQELDETSLDRHNLRNIVGVPAALPSGYIMTNNIIMGPHLNLEGIDLTDINIAEDYPEFVSLEKSSLKDANLSGSNLSGFNLKGTDFSGTNLSGTNLSGADLKGVDFSSTNLSGTNLSGADLSDGIFLPSDLTNTNLDDTIFSTQSLTNFGFYTFKELNKVAANIANDSPNNGLTEDQANAIIANTEKVGITPEQVNSISINSSNIVTIQNRLDITNSISERLNFESININNNRENIEANNLAIEANTAKVGITQDQTNAIISNTTKIDGIITDVATQFETLGQNDASIGEQLTALGQNDTAIGEQLTALGQNDTAIGEQMDTLSESNQSIIADITAMKAQLQTLVASVAEKDAQIAEKDAKIAELEQGGGGQSLEQVLEQVRDARAGSVVLTVDPEGDNITLGLTIEQSDNLIEWTKLDGEITRTIPIPEGKKFYRFALDK